MPGRLNSIDALRGLAALVVLAFHARGSFWVGLRETWRAHGLSASPEAVLGYLTAPMYFGGLGVTLFFVLSGYCIHRRGAQLLARNPGASLDLQEFALRRLWRIYPTYAAALALTFLLDRYVSVQHAGQTSVIYDGSVRGLLINLLSLQGFAAAVYGSNHPFWSLSVELHLYAVYPLLFLVRRKWGPARALALTAFISLVYVILFRYFDGLAYLPYYSSRGPVFLPFWFTWTIGFYLAEVEVGTACVPNGIGRLAAVGVIASSILALRGEWDFAEFGFAVAMGWLVFWSMGRSGVEFWSRTSGKLLAWVGTFSFSLYATHAPCLLALASILFPTKSTNLWPAAMAGLLCLVFAWVFFLVIERPTLQAPVWLLRRDPQPVLAAASLGHPDRSGTVA